MDKDNQTFGQRMLAGWRNFFSSNKENQEINPENGLRFFPADHQYSVKELEKMSQKTSPTAMESMVLETGLMDVDQDANQAKSYNPVIWKDGLMSWVGQDGTEHPDNQTTRIHKLQDLKDNGYELPIKFEDMLKNYQADRLVGGVYEEGENYLRIDGYDPAKDGDVPMLTTTSFNKKTMEAMEIPVQLDYFLNQQKQSNVRQLYDGQLMWFKSQVEDAQNAQKNFDESLNFIKNAVKEGEFLPFGNFDEVATFAELGVVRPIGYGYKGDDIIYKADLLSYDTENDETKIGKADAYLQRDVLNVVHHFAEIESYNKDVVNLAKALGTQENGSYFCKVSIKGNDIDLLIDTNGFIKVRDNNEDREYFGVDEYTRELAIQQGFATLGTLSSNSVESSNQIERLKALTAFNSLDKTICHIIPNYNEYVQLVNDNVESTKQLSAVLDAHEYLHSVQEYMNTMNDNKNLLSGNFIEHLPKDSELQKLYGRYETLSEEASKVRWGLPHEEGYQKELSDSLYSAQQSFGEKLRSLVKEYQFTDALGEYGTNANKIIDTLAAMDKESLILQDISLTTPGMFKHRANLLKNLEELNQLTEGKAVETVKNFADLTTNSHILVPVEDLANMKAYVSTLSNTYDPNSGNLALLSSNTIDSNKVKIEVENFELLKNLNGETIHKEIQGINGYTVNELKNVIQDNLVATLSETLSYDYGQFDEIKGIEIHGSRGRGTAKENSDLDVVVEYQGKAKEDGVFNLLNEEPLYIEGIRVDVNPIRAQETGTLEEYMVKSKAYDQEKLKEYGTEKAQSMDTLLDQRFEKERQYLIDHPSPYDEEHALSQIYKTIIDSPDWRTAVKNLKNNGFLASAEELTGKIGANYYPSDVEVPTIRFSRPLQVETTNVFSMKEEQMQALYDKERTTVGYTGDYKKVLDSHDNWRSAVAAFYNEADDLRKLLHPGADDYGMVFKDIQEQEGFADTLLNRIGASQVWKTEQRDAMYMEAVNSGDMRSAQSLVNEAAAEKGYSISSAYQGTSAFNGAAPYGNGYFNSPEERKEAWENGDYEGDQTLEDYIKNGVDNNDLNFIALDQRNWRSADDNRREAIENVRNAIQSKSETITMYRSVPSDIKEGSFRNGDWVTPSKGYAIDNAKVHGWGDNYRIIEQQVPTSHIWWDGNDIAEWGYGREQDYVNDKDFAYKNTLNNRKSLEPVTYDDKGNVIPLSQRFNEKMEDIRYQKENNLSAPSKEEAELRDTLIGKLRSTGIDVITDVSEGQHVLDLYNGTVRRQSAYHGSGANFDKFDFSHIGEGATSSKEIGMSYAKIPTVDHNKNIYNGKEPLSQNEIYALSSFLENHRNYDGTLKDCVTASIKAQKGIIERYPNNLLSQNIEKSVKVLEGLVPRLGKISWDDFEKSGKNLYEVEIPDDNGHNYLNYNSRNSEISKDMLDSLSKELEREGWKRKDMPSFMGFTDGYGSIIINPNATGADLYKELEDAFKSPKEASELLSKAGFVGIKYDAGTIMGGAKEGDTNYVIFREDDMKIKDHIRYFKDKGGTSYGFTVNDKIYVDPRIATAETPIHEYTHLWATAMQKGNPKEWQNIVGLMKNTPIWNEVKANYKDLKSDDAIADEVLATYSGQTGAEKLRQKMTEANTGNFSATKKSNIQRGIAHLQQALEKFWKSVASFLGIHYNSAEQVADQVMKDMLNGVNPSKALETFTKQRDQEYEEAVASGDMEKAYVMVKEQADMKLADNPMPEVTDAYSVRKEALPTDTIKVYKVFTLDKDGDPSALFISGKDKLPTGVWLDAQDTWHFTAANGKDYVPSTKNPSTQGSKTGASIEIPNNEVRQELIKRGFLPEGSKAKTITALAYRPGWHAADLPYFPQGGKQVVDSNYGHVHRYNQVVFECDMIANKNYTDEAQAQSKAHKADGSLNARNADLQYLPKDGYYKYTTNQFLEDEDKGHWYIGSSIRINRALTQEECDKILKENGKAVQEWEQDHLDLNKLGYASAMAHVKPILAPVAYDERGNLIPLSQRFEDIRTSVDEPRRLFIGEYGAKIADQIDHEKSGISDYRIGMLSLAKTMYKDKQTAEDIKRTTGWELGVDNNWKYEMEDVKRFDWNGNIAFEQHHPDFKRYMELIYKDNEHVFNEGEALRPSEVDEYDKLSEKYGSTDRKFDNIHTLEAYVDAPELYKAYPELKNVKVDFKPLEGEARACYATNSSALDFLLDINGTEEYGGTITINTNKLNRFQFDGEINKVMSHELQHAVQGLEGFAKGGDPNTIRDEIKQTINENQQSKDYIVSHLKEWATLNDLALKLENSQKELQREGADWQEIGKRHYWEAMNEIDANMDGKFNLVNDYEEKFGKDYDVMDIARSGYHVDEAASELRRVAQEHKDILTSADYFTLKQMSVMEDALKKDTNDQMYWYMAGEVEARNTARRIDMTPLERKNSLASDTEDVDRSEQIVITSTGVKGFINLDMEPVVGRWHTEEQSEIEAYREYSNLFAKLIKYNQSGSVWNAPDAQAIDLSGQKFDIGDSFLLSLYGDIKGYSTPIYVTEEQVRQANLMVHSNAEPFSLVTPLGVKNLYNISEVAPSDGDWKLLNSAKEKFTEMQDAEKGKENTLSVLPQELVSQLKMPSSEEEYKDKSFYRADIAEKLIEINRGPLAEEYGKRSKQQLESTFTHGMLGGYYGFQVGGDVEGSKELKARMERDPLFAKEVFTSAKASASKIVTFVDDTVKSFGDGKKIDLRSLTPVNIDVDGDGIIESQENLAADSKESEENGEKKSKEHSAQAKAHR